MTLTTNLDLTSPTASPAPNQENPTEPTTTTFVELLDHASNEDVTKTLDSYTINENKLLTS